VLGYVTLLISMAPANSRSLLVSAKIVWIDLNLLELATEIGVHVFPVCPMRRNVVVAPEEEILNAYK